MEKINLVEILKDCPKGMELDCILFDDVYFDCINDVSGLIECYVQDLKHRIHISFNKYGCYTDISKAKCAIFPKGKTTWEGFVPPCKFKDGDVLFVDCSDDEEDKLYQYIFILNKPEFKGKWNAYCHLDGVGDFYSQETYLTDEEYHPRFATEEEKQKLFDAIKDNGYKWNAETKTLEKLPKFKVGDRVRLKSKPNYVYTIHSLTWDDNNKLAYRLLPDNDKHLRVISLIEQNEYELVPNKFDINTLVPFESRVLMRNTELDKWSPGIWGYYDKSYSYPYKLIGTISKQCIPYERNEYLLGTTNDCSEFYKNWK